LFIDNGREQAMVEEGFEGGSCVRGEMGNEEMDVMLFFFRATAKWQLLLLFVATKESVDLVGVERN
jgi:hypothetical protein